MGKLIKIREIRNGSSEAIAGETQGFCSGNDIKDNSEYVYCLK